MRYVYYCKKCGYTGSDDGTGKKITCPQCKSALYSTELPRDEWAAKTDEEKEALKAQWAKSADVPSQNTVASTLKTIGLVLLFLSAIGGGLVLEAVGLVAGAIAGGISCAIMYGFGEIIDLLQAIKDKPSL